jgi:hypothetical protein
LRAGRPSRHRHLRRGAKLKNRALSGPRKCPWDGDSPATTCADGPVAKCFCTMSLVVHCHSMHGIAACVPGECGSRSPRGPGARNCHPSRHSALDYLRSNLAIALSSAPCASPRSRDSNIAASVNISPRRGRGLWCLWRTWGGQGREKHLLEMPEMPHGVPGSIRYMQEPKMAAPQRQPPTHPKQASPHIWLIGYISK